MIPASARTGRSKPSSTTLHLPGKAPKLHKLALIHGTKWAIKRRGTRITPFVMGMTWLLTPFAMYVFDPLILLICGACLTWLVWLTQRQVVNPAADNDIAERQASQWAWRSALVPAAGTVYLEWALWAHANNQPVYTRAHFILYALGCTALWTFLFTTGYVSAKRLREQLTRTWGIRTVGTVLEGSRIVTRRRTTHGEEVDLDVTDVQGLPSGLLSAQAKEDIAVRHKIPVERVQIRRNPKDASKVTVQITHKSPWKGEVEHPLHAKGYTLGIPGDRSIRMPAIVGVDPTEHDEAKRVITKELFTGDGAQHILIVAGTGGGKTNLINNLVEHGTDCYDCDVVMMDVTKAIDASVWRWACLRVHLGPDALEAAIVELESAVNLIKARSEKRRNAIKKTAVFQPTKTDRDLLIILDEADQVLVEAPRHLKTRAQSAVKYILSKGRSEGVHLIIAAQRGTLDYLGKGDVKANSFTRIVLGVSQTSEMSWALPGWEGRGIPDMATYGEGAAGVFVLAEPRSFRTGRSCALYNSELIEAIAMDRVRPEHLDELVRYFHQLVDEGHSLPVLAGGRWADTLATTGLPPLPTAPVATGPARGDVVRLDPAFFGADRSNVVQLPAYGTPPAGPVRSASAAAAVEEMQTQTSRAVAYTAHLADQAHGRGPVALEDLVVARRSRVDALGAGTGTITGLVVDVPTEVRRYALALAGRSGIRGFSRAELEQGLTQVVDRMPSSRYVQAWLRVMCEDGDLALFGKSRAQRYRLPRQAAS